MSNILTICLFAPAVLFGLWLLVRIGMIFLDLAFYTNPAPGMFHFAAWLLRGVVLFVSLDSLAFSGFLAWWCTSLLDDQQTALCHSLTIYASVAFVLSLPGFPLRLHMRAVYPAQLLLIPILGLTATQGIDFLCYAIPLALFVALWFWSLHSRFAIASERLNMCRKEA